ncbi:hypothetical protein [Melittangium boletus]|uniref:hypothetical protein n=1 Tax=Melittangium boletus TaxID=83453 RepID=UPI003DA55531
MRGAKWMALALLGTAPLALAQPPSGVGTGVAAPASEQPAASPTGAVSIERGEDSAGTSAAFGTTGQPAGGALFPGIPGLNGIPLQTPATQGGVFFGTGGSGMGGSGMTGSNPGPTYYGAPATPTDSGGTSSSQDVTELNQRVDTLEREVSALRGTGGSGTVAPNTAAQAPRQTQAPAGQAQGTAGTNASGTPVTGTPDEALPAITVEFDGRVRDVTSKYVEVEDSTDGTVSRLRIDDQTRVFRGSTRNPIPVKQLSEGAQVRTSFAYVDGEELARDIVVLSRARGSQR